MLRVFVGILIVSLVAVIGYAKFGNPALDERSAIEQAIQNAKASQPLNREEELLLRLQFAIIDYQKKSKGNHPPATLSELVPTYFDSVPKDPRTKKEIEYARVGKQFRLGDQVNKAPVQVASLNPNGTRDISISENPRIDDSALEASLFGDKYVNPNTLEEEIFIYDPTGKRDPFAPFDFSPQVKWDGTLTPLEHYSVGQLRLTAVLAAGEGDMTAIVEDSVGKGYTVRKGTKIGNKGGVVVEIHANHLKIVETITDFSGEEKRNLIEMQIVAKQEETQGKKKR